MKRPVILFGLITLLACSQALAQQSKSFDPKAATYLWPTEASPYLTSTFAETRSAHFHAALDIKTWGQRGYEVYATRDGIVNRIAIGPTGYGKVIYLRHSDGSYSVYAHLLSFNNKLQQIADSTRFAQNYQFEMDRYLGWKNITVEQGDVIGYSGASGIGPPHLHFELRTPSDKPFNPLLTNLSVEDDIAPQILGLSIEPQSAAASVEGENRIFTKRVWGKKPKYDFGTINVSGPVGLGINAFDKSNQVHNSYAVYELSMEIDGEQLFKSRVDSFAYHETGQMFIDRVYPILKEEGAGYQRLYTADGNSLPFYPKNNGILSLPPGTHEVTIHATDYYGNQTMATVRLDVQDPQIQHPSMRNWHAKVNKQGISSPEQWIWFNNWMLLPDNQIRQLTFANTDSSNFITHRNGTAVNLQATGDLFANIPNLGPLNLRRITPEKWHIIPSAEGPHFATMPSGTVHDTVSVGMHVQQSDDNITVQMIPDAYPLKGTYSFYVDSNQWSDTSHLAFYRYERDDDEWELIPTIFQDGYITGHAESLGKFALKKDTTPPVLTNVRLHRRPDGHWLVMVDVTDNLSGIDYHRTKMSVNGMRGIAEYEPEDQRLVFYHPNFEPSTTINLDVTAYDQMGNKQQQIFRIDNRSAKK